LFNSVLKRLGRGFFSKEFVLVSQEHGFISRGDEGRGDKV
jgi:hypothetical protein